MRTRPGNQWCSSCLLLLLLLLFLCRGEADVLRLSKPLLVWNMQSSCLVFPLKAEASDAMNSHCVDGMLLRGRLLLWDVPKLPWRAWKTLKDVWERAVAGFATLPGNAPKLCYEMENLSYCCAEGRARPCPGQSGSDRASVWGSMTQWGV